MNLSSSNCISYRINGTTVKLLGIEGKTEGNLDILPETNIKFQLKCSKIKTKVDISTIVENNKIPDHMKPRIFMIHINQGYDLKENEFWLTLDELNKQKQFVVNLVNRTDRWCIGAVPSSTFHTNIGYTNVGDNRFFKIQSFDFCSLSVDVLKNK